MYFVYFALAFLVSIVSTRLLINLMARLDITAIPNHRSNHKAPIPVGGGVAIISAILAGIALYAWQYGLHEHTFYFILAIIIVACVSLWDDISEVSIPTRILFQAVAIYLTIKSLPQYDHTILLHFLSLTAEKFVAGISLMLFINIYNFMDGIDGLTASQTIYITAIVLVFSVFSEKLDGLISYLCISVIGACLGFIVYNWHPARIFMGDIGSIALGLVCGWLLLNLGINGYLAAAVIIPGYYLADSLTTIIRRLARGEKIWHAHSEHFFQQAVRRGKSHAQVTKKIIYCNLALFGLSLFSIIHSYTALIAAAMLIIVFLRRI